MRIFCAAATYRPLVEALYRETDDLASQPYEVQRSRHESEAMGMAAGIASGMKDLGHDVWLVFPDNTPQQRAWAHENGLLNLFADAETIGSGGDSSLWGMGPWTWPCLVAQIKAFQPDLIFSDNLILLGGPVLRQVRDQYGKAVGFHCSPMFPNVDHNDLVSGLSLMLAGSIPVRQWYRDLGIEADLMRYGFDTQITGRLPPERTVEFGLSFVGQVGPDYYKQRTLLLERLCRAYDVALFASKIESIAKADGIKARYRGERWGRSAFDAMRHSQITLNVHEDGAGPYIGNMRLFEATGLGCCVLTDRKDDLGDVFAYGDADNAGSFGL